MQIESTATEYLNNLQYFTKENIAKKSLSTKILQNLFIIYHV